jgi:hypothetical protein
MAELRPTVAASAAQQVQLLCDAELDALAVAVALETQRRRAAKAQP